MGRIRFPDRPDGLPAPDARPEMLPLRRAESIPPNDVNAPIEPPPDDCAERPECALSFADLARLREEAGELPPSTSAMTPLQRARLWRQAQQGVKTSMVGDGDGSFDAHRDTHF